MAWNEDEKATVKQCWADGWPAERIADEKFPTKTRSAVAGLIFRMGLPKRGPKVSAAKQQAAKSIAANPGAYVLDHSFPQRKTLLQLTSKCCHWPVGDPGRPDFFFCGANKLDAPTSYCGYHHLVSREPQGAAA